MRELARRRYLPYLQRMVPGFKAGWFHKDMCLELEQFSAAVARMESPRLIIEVPPRAGKSETGTKTFPTWHLGKYPEHEVIITSYASALAESFSRRNRAIMRSDDYAKIFETQLDPDTQSVQNWMTTAGGGVLAAGVGGPITGRGAHILFIDDPVKNMEEADSETVRQAIKEWYTSTAYTRLAPGGGVIIIMTRWHHDDLAGWLQGLAASGEGDQWKVVRYPAIAEEDERYRKKGEALHPERYDTKALTRIRRAVGERVWQALYQQNPTAQDGSYFTRSMLRFYKWADLPSRDSLTFFCAWDLAIGQRQHNDFSVGITGGVDNQGRLWLVDVVRGRWESFELVTQILDMQKRWGAVEVGIEKSMIEMSIAPLLRQQIKERKQYNFFHKPLKTGRSDKVARARTVQGIMQNGMLMVPQDLSWTQTLVNELLQFPNGTHDDQADSLAWLGTMLDSYYGPGAKREEKKPSWRDKLDKLTSSVASGSSAMGA